METWVEGISHTNTVSISNISEWCPDGVPWVRGQPFLQCISSPLQYAAFIIGLSSTLCWLFAQLPQVITNFRTMRADVALSFWFLLIWILGDVTNMVGAILTHQLTTEIVTAVYFVCMDCVLIFQWILCTIKNRGLKVCLHSPNSQAVLDVLCLFHPCQDCHQQCKQWKRQYLLPAVITPLALTCFLATSVCALGTTSGVGLFGGERPSYQHTAFKGRHLLESYGQDDEPVVDVNSWQSVVGYVIGCVSGFLYLISRIPQIIKNFRRRSVEGLSFLLFFFAVMGNVTYSLGILMYSVQPVFVLQKLPWLIGSAGTLCLDFTIFVQFCIFGTRADWKKSLCDCGCDCSCSCAGGSTGERQPLVINGKEGQGRTDALQSVPPPGAQ